MGSVSKVLVVWFPPVAIQFLRNRSVFLVLLCSWWARSHSFELLSSVLVVLPDYLYSWRSSSRSASISSRSNLL
uniref:Uncharacterized protein n=1 Tax=Ixodes ricinus TaxID=34613 RepID=A0A0K8R7M4_IXORI